MAFNNPPVVTAQMLIRKPIAEVFEAFVNPDITSRFWFTRSSGRLETGAMIRWDWEMYGVGADVTVLAVEPNRRIHIEWGDPPCLVEWHFTPHGDSAALVRISNSGFTGRANEIMEKALDAKGGFTSVLAAAKALLEHGIELNLVADQYPGDDE